MNIYFTWKSIVIDSEILYVNVSTLVFLLFCGALCIVNVFVKYRRWNAIRASQRATQKQLDEWSSTKVDVYTF